MVILVAAEALWKTETYAEWVTALTSAVIRHCVLGLKCAALAAAPPCQERQRIRGQQRP